MTCAKMISMKAAIAVLGVAISSPVYAERLPSRAGPDARIQVVNFHASDVVRINTALVTNTAVEFDRGESVRSVLVGDSESFEVHVLSSANVISIKPIVARAATNMTVYTDRRSYSFYMTEGSGQPPFRVMFNYPEARRQSAAPAPNYGLARDMAYQWRGNAPEILPVRVWNNGEATFFEFRGETLPSIFAVDSRGNERSVNSTTMGNVVRVRGTGTEFTLRYGDAWLCIRRVEGQQVFDAALIRDLAAKEARWQ